MAHVWGAGGDAMSRPEVDQKALEEGAQEAGQQALVAEDEAGEAADEVREDADHLDGAPEASPGAGRGADRKKTPWPKGPLQRQAEARGQSMASLARKSAGSGFLKPGEMPEDLHASAYAATVRAAAVQDRLGVGRASLERTPDAFTLLQQAQEGGVLFKEVLDGEGRSPEEPDPDLAQAVEECIRLCFGLRGILRIAPGTNDLGEPIVVVTAAPGLTVAGFEMIPAQVHRFATLVAIPFDILPLRRDA